MSRSQDDKKSQWDQVMQQFDLLFSRVNDISVVQRQLKTQMNIRGAVMDRRATYDHSTSESQRASSSPTHHAPVGLGSTL